MAVITTKKYGGTKVILVPAKDSPLVLHFRFKNGAMIASILNS